MTKTTAAFHKKSYVEASEWSDMTTPAPTAPSGKKRRFTSGQDKPPAPPVLDKAERERLRRRARKQKLKMFNTVCFSCRKPGHAIKDCPEAGGAVGAGETPEELDATGICYKCKSKDHKSSQCRSTGTVEYPYAKVWDCHWFIL
jgi:zinc finger CCHC domain-containing protein 9